MELLDQLFNCNNGHSDGRGRFTIAAISLSLLLHALGGAVFVIGMNRPRSMSRPHVIEILMVNPEPQEEDIPKPRPIPPLPVKQTKTPVKPTPQSLPAPQKPAPAIPHLNVPLEAKNDAISRKGALPVPATPSRDRAVDSSTMKKIPATSAKVASPHGAGVAGLRNNVGEVTTIGPSYDAAYLNNPAPPYPAAARRLRLQGTATVRVLVSPDGRPKSVRLEKTSGVRILDDAALEAVHHWSFVPARRGDNPVAAEVDVPVRFRLD